MQNPIDQIRPYFINGEGSNYLQTIIISENRMMEMCALEKTRQRVVVVPGVKPVIKKGH
jgi:hypothetical protein